MKSISLIFGICLFLTLRSQTYYSEYQGIRSTFLKLTHTTDSIESVEPIIDLFSNADVVVKYKMSVYSNCDYAYCKCELQESNFPFIPPGEESNEYFLLDYKKKILYDLSNKKYSHYINPNKLDKNTGVSYKNNDSIFTKVIVSDSEPKDTALITFSKALPKCLTNKIILLDNEYGVQKIQTKKGIITLSSFQANTSFDFEKQLEYALKNCKEQSKSENYLFR